MARYAVHVQALLALKHDLSLLSVRDFIPARPATTPNLILAHRITNIAISRVSNRPLKTNGGTGGSSNVPELELQLTAYLKHMQRPMRTCHGALWTPRLSMLTPVPVIVSIARLMLS